MFVMKQNNIMPGVRALLAVALLSLGTAAAAQTSPAVYSTVVSGDQLASGTRTLSESLSGVVPGLLVRQTSGTPGDGASLRIRGLVSSATDADPLILINGVESDIDLVDVDDVESVAILKDASAIALYGVRGANGVILVTTKHGLESKPVVKANARFGITQPLHLPQLASTAEWIGYYNDLASQNGTASPFTADVTAKYLNGTDGNLYPSVDWVDESFKNLSTTSRYNVSVTGGSRKVHYYISGSYSDQKGLFNTDKSNSWNPQANYQRVGFHSNVDITLSKSTTLNFGIASQFKITNSPVSSISTIMSDILAASPVSGPVKYSDGSLSEPEAYSAVNPYNDINAKGYKKGTTVNAQTHVTLRQDFSSLITEGLAAKINFTFAATAGNTLSRYRNPVYYYMDTDNPYADDGSLNLYAKNDGSNYLTLSRTILGTTILTVQPAITYDRTFGDHSLSAVVQMDLRYRTQNVPTSYLYAYPYRHLALGGRIDYGFKNKLFVDAALSYSGSDNFEKGHRFGLYPSVSAAYVISEEPFWTNIKPVVSKLKINASYGLTGSDYTGYSYRRYVYNNTLDTDATSATFGTSGQYSPDGISTYYHGYAGLDMEKSTKLNIGVDLQLFDKLSITAAYYTDKREGIFMADNVSPSVSGLTNNYINVGKIDNKGFELAASYVQNFNKDYSLEVFGNFLFNRSNVIDDGYPAQPEKTMDTQGHPYGQQFGLIALGLFKDDAEIAGAPVQKFGDTNPGDIRYKDVNEDGVVDYKDMVAIGRTSIPEISYGFGFTLRLKSFDISARFAGVANVTRILSGSAIMGGAEEPLYTGQIYSDVANNRWTPANQDVNAKYPRMYLNGSTNNSVASTWRQENMGYLRLKNVEAGYTFLKKYRVFVAADNCLTFSKFKMWDPELASTTGAAYPLTSAYILGLNLTF